MNLQELRQRINEIDETLEKLFASRMECSFLVACNKLDGNDEIYKPDREHEICEKYKDNPSYQAFIIKIMQISRKYQYSIFAGRDIFKEKYVSRVTASNLKAFSEGGELELNLLAASGDFDGLPAEAIISIISDSGLKIEKLVCEDNRVYARLFVEDDTEKKFNALVLTYMLYMETI